MMRVGQGYDAHRLAENRRLVIGGVEIPFEKGLLGHSDADVLTHALMDALLGSAALGDIGQLFPDSDDAYLGADSIALLTRVCQVLSRHGYKLVNADCTVVAQRPKLAGYIPEMRRRLAQAMIRAVADLSGYGDVTGTVMPGVKVYIDGQTNVGAVGDYTITVDITKG